MLLVTVAQGQAGGRASRAKQVVVLLKQSRTMPGIAVTNALPLLQVALRSWQKRRGEPGSGPRS